MPEILEATEHDIGGLTVKRMLPNMKKKMVGPFIFFDHLGPSTFSEGDGIDVLPHPHIGLSTLTYLFTGSILHRDSLGNHQEIHPGDVNWMTAGQGIVHSERESIEVRTSQHQINGLQCWIALPEALETIEPSFHHIKKEQLPQLNLDGKMIRLIVGEAYGMSSPVKTYSPMFYLDVVAPAGASIDQPQEHQETAIYLIYGQIEIQGATYEAGDFVLLEEEDSHFLCTRHTRCIVLGGKKFTKTPYIHWNFVSFSRDRIEEAKKRWKTQGFPSIPEDNQEYVALGEFK
ncbi:pirin family protein [Litoribrevibacter euphylliae]|uniref:Pirin family protein n=1 Tax=Litoribrevibacter euphylliae TaxID=1834034 RepID=A0ABV7HE09_9GAMM